MSNSGSPNRGRVGTQNMVMNAIGLIALALGIWLFSVTKINYVTAQTSSPYLVPGVVLAIIGALLLIFSRISAKRNLRK